MEGRLVAATPRGVADRLDIVAAGDSLDVVMGMEFRPGSPFRGGRLGAGCPQAQIKSRER